MYLKFLIYHRNRFNKRNEEVDKDGEEHLLKSLKDVSIENEQLKNRFLDIFLPLVKIPNFLFPVVK